MTSLFSRRIWLNAPADLAHVMPRLFPDEYPPFFDEMIRLFSALC